MSTMRVTTLKNENSATDQIVLNADGSIGGELGDTLAAKAPSASPTFTGTVATSAITATGNITVDKTLPGILLDADGSGDAARIRFLSGGTVRWQIEKSADAESGSNVGSNFTVTRYSDAGAALATAVQILRSSGLTRMPGVYGNTAASAANVFVDTDGSLYRSTSSLKYKTDVQDATDAEQDALLALRPVTYRSLSDADDSGARFWGFIAEEVEEIDPRLVTHNEDGEPEGVQYDRIVPALVGIIRRLEARVAALESA